MVAMASFSATVKWISAVMAPLFVASFYAVVASLYAVVASLYAVVASL